MSSTHQERYNIGVEFKDYLLKKFWEWEKSTGKRQSFSAFANYLGVKQSAFAHWIGGNITPSRESVDKLAEKLGEETYDAAGLPRPDPRISLVGLPPDVAEALEHNVDRALSKIKLELESRGLDSGDPEARPIVTSILAEFGIEVKTISVPD